MQSREACRPSKGRKDVSERRPCRRTSKNLCKFIGTTRVCAVLLVLHLSFLRVGQAQNPDPDHTPTKLGDAGLDRLGLLSGELASQSEDSLLLFFDQVRFCRHQNAKVSNKNQFFTNLSTFQTLHRAAKQSHPPQHQLPSVGLLVQMHVSLS